MLISALLLDVYKMAKVVPEVDTALSATYAADGLRYLNQMLDSWSANGLTSPYRVIDSYSWGSGSASRTIGSTGDFSGARPTAIKAAYIRESSQDTPVRVASFEEYQRISDKTASGRPTLISYQETMPNGTVYAWPVPDQTYTIRLEREYITPALASSDDYIPGPGWLDAVMYNLVVKVAPIYDTQLNPLFMVEAQASLSTIRSAAHSRASDPLNPVISKSRAFNIDTGY